ncbi:uncharacterized protein [Typha angustifolia]|uniref:uncharacterized protein n=1 Tax=Typha angustifolia TaxID=59011 RepID=UPI003C2C0F0A
MGEWTQWRGPTSSWRPPHPPGSANLSVPLWEKKFCSHVCAIPWKKLCETKQFMCMFKNVLEWDDSAALDAFHNAKTRFWAEYHGQPCDIPLPDPDMYIDKVNPYAIVDPELVMDLESPPPMPADDNNAGPSGWDSFAFTNKPIPATGWDDAEAVGTSSQHQPVNWDIYIEKPIQITGWGDTAEPYSSSWEVKDDSFDAWNCSSHGWVGGPAEDDPWAGGSNNHWVHGRSSCRSHGYREDRHNESSRRNGRKRDGRGCLGSRVAKPKYQMDGYQSNNNWRSCRGRTSTNYPYNKTAYAKQPLAM